MLAININQTVTRPFLPSRTTQNARLAVSNAPALGGLAPWQAHSVRRYIREHIDTDLSLGDIASIARLSKNYFSRTFKVTFGCTPRDYITRQRICAAQDLMLDSDKSLSEIALDCGFCDQPHLCRVFRNIVGVTPHRWRLHQMAA